MIKTRKNEKTHFYALNFVAHTEYLRVYTVTFEETNIEKYTNIFRFKRLARCSTYYICLYFRSK